MGTEGGLSPHQFPFAGKQAVHKDALFGGVGLQAEGPFTALRLCQGKLELATTGNASGPEARPGELWLCGSFRAAPGEALGPRGKLWTGGDTSTLGWGEPRWACCHILVEPWGEVPAWFGPGHISKSLQPSFPPPSQPPGRRRRSVMLCPVAVCEPQSGAHGLTKTNMI